VQRLTQRKVAGDGHTAWSARLCGPLSPSFVDNADAER